MWRRAKEECDERLNSRGIVFTSHLQGCGSILLPIEFFLFLKKEILDIFLKIIFFKDNF